MAYPSAFQLISPAFERTKQFLFKPFRMGRFLKLTLVALLTEGGSAGISSGGNFPSSMHPGSSAPQNLPHIDWPALTHWATHLALIGAVVLLITLPIGLLVSYLLIRLRFSYFDCVLRQQDQISPAWGIYHRQALRYLGLTVLVGLGFWIVLIPIGYGVYEHFKPLIQSIFSGHPPDLWDLLPIFFVIAPLIMLLALVAAIVQMVMSCFVLPRMALEDASIGDALSDVWSDMAAEPGQFLLFAFLRLVLALAGTIIGGIAIFFPAGILFVLGVIFVLVVKSMSMMLAFILGIPLAILAIALLLGIVIAVHGTVGTFMRNYAILFYGGRYPVLGSMLPPPAPPRVWQPGFVPPPNPIAGT
jgi:hypothetical protein